MKQLERRLIAKAANFIAWKVTNKVLRNALLAIRDNAIITHINNV